MYTSRAAGGRNARGCDDPSAAAPTVAAMSEDTLRRAVAEAIGAFTLTFVGAGAAVAARGVSDPTLIGVAIANGLAIGVMVCAFGHISGGHFNPAVTLGFLVARRIKPWLAAVYWVAQLAGAALAALLVKSLLPGILTRAVKLGVPALGHGVNASSGFVIEAILTFFLVVVVFGAAVDKRNAHNAVAGLAIGLTICIDVLFGGPFTGAAMNPSRAFGPQLVGGYWANGWVWYVGPLLGGAVAGLLWAFLFIRHGEDEAAQADLAAAPPPGARALRQGS
jgi:MIP family channel proteins